jgi:hypothetical protein
MEYGIAFWGGAAESKRVFQLQKRIIRIMTGSNPRTFCKPLYRSSEILTLPSQYILSLMKLLLQNMANYTRNFAVHGINTRNKSQLYKPASNLALYHRRVYFMSIKVFSKLPGFIADIVSDKKHFILTLKMYLIEKSFYSLEDFLMINIHVMKSEELYVGVVL